MAKTLTAAAVEKLKPDPEKRREVPDKGQPGLYLVIQPSGWRSWAARYRLNGRPRKTTIGPWPRIDLPTARTAAQAIVRAASEGRDPEFQKPEPEHVANSIDAIWTDYAKRHLALRRPATVKSAQRVYNRHLKPWGARWIGEISRRDILDILDTITNAGYPAAAIRAKAVLSKFFNWARGRDIIKSSPCEGIELIEPEARESNSHRILSDAEIRKVWNACSKVGYPFGPMFKLLLLTGQRRDEVAKMTYGEIEGRIWIIPGARAKNRQSHDVYLSDAAVKIIEELPTDSGFLFTMNNKTPSSGYSSGKEKIDAFTGPIPAWRLHDLRRTMVSGMARLGIAIPTVEKAINHRSGTFAGIVGTYQKHDFAAETKIAFERWAYHVESVVNCHDDPKVVPLRST
ncbi:site-specific integrase [Bradyrhizobium lablabi]|uniref:tyrosine-type recombinase/integrase n=1 Tax=Bradyrhizobium lablabi TaxID=722472 RepID=UPI001BA714B6|nr:site-specific integrase [Bradyrhizobium lablabi]MBR0695273.1 site-specific integrase [Bradyrhizobium lablabi]